MVIMCLYYYSLYPLSIYPLIGLHCKLLHLVTLYFCNKLCNWVEIGCMYIVQKTMNQIVWLMVEILHFAVRPSVMHLLVLWPEIFDKSKTCKKNTVIWHFVFLGLLLLPPSGSTCSLASKQQSICLQNEQFIITSNLKKNRIIHYVYNRQWRKSLGNVSKQQQQDYSTVCNGCVQSICALKRWWESVLHWVMSNLRSVYPSG